MLVEIFSMMAAVSGDRKAQWEGDVSGDYFPADSTTEDMNEILWRFFNRVDTIDNERLEAIGYFLPSLSVGDFISWGGNTYRVLSAGFEKITGNYNYMNRA